jgi:hypothetical protein
MVDRIASGMVLHADVLHGIRYLRSSNRQPEYRELKGVWMKPSHDNGYCW